MAVPLMSELHAFQTKPERGYRITGDETEMASKKAVITPVPGEPNDYIHVTKKTLCYENKNA
jgi:hypothetical protein